MIMDTLVIVDKKQKMHTGEEVDDQDIIDRVICKKEEYEPVLQKIQMKTDGSLIYKGSLNPCVFSGGTVYFTEKQIPQGSWLLSHC